MTGCLNWIAFAAPVRLLGGHWLASDGRSIETPIRDTAINIIKFINRVVKILTNNNNNLTMCWKDGQHNYEHASVAIVVGGKRGYAENRRLTSVSGSGSTAAETVSKRQQQQRR